MILHVMKYDIHPDKIEEYAAWTKAVLPKMLAVPGCVEFRGYRAATGSSQVVFTLEFSDMQAWATWQDNETIQKMGNERRAFTINETHELWGPSPVIPAPIRPGG